MKQMKKGVLFGEVLFDVFPDGKKVLGGAPFNVAWHLHGLGAEPLFIGRVGNDENGEEVMQRMREWGMDMSGMQVDEAYPTGRVSITLENGQPDFNIEADQAYDFVDADAVTIPTDGCGVLYHGSLALRTDRNRDALESIKKQSKAPVFMDINLRKPWWKKEDVLQMLNGVDWIKLNDIEIRELLDNDSDADESLPELGKRMLDMFGNKIIILTAGEDGAYFITKDKVITEKPRKIEHLVDTVGAGDALSSVTILGLGRGWALETIAKRAVGFASDICEYQGATVSDRQFYQRKREEWGLQ